METSETLDDLRLFLTEKVISELPDFSSVDSGYHEPGHGVKGGNQWLNNHDDVYAKHAGR